MTDILLQVSLQLSVDVRTGEVYTAPGVPSLTRVDGFGGGQSQADKRAENEYKASKNDFDYSCVVGGGASPKKGDVGVSESVVGEFGASTGEVLEDKSSTGRSRPWRKKKLANEALALVYDEVDRDKALRLRDCTSKLVFDVSPDGKKKLEGAFFCRVRLCPMCSWRRSLKVAAQMSQIMDAMKKDKQFGFIFLTLTMRNCTGDQLSDELTKISGAFNLMTRRADFKAAVSGYYRAIEVTHDVERVITEERYEQPRFRKYYDERSLSPGSWNPNFDTYHTHIHAVLVVNQSYFTGRTYISHDQWVDLWQSCLKAGYEPYVDVRKVKGDTAKAVAEVAKYAVKEADYIIPDEWKLTVDTVRVLDKALHNRRFVTFGGVFKDYHKKLHLDDVEDGDLITVDAEKMKPEGRKVSFVWHSGYRQYISAGEL